MHENGSRHRSQALQGPRFMKGTKIGLALSGGGSRAIAFHLGCLRALHELEILDNVKVISTVSGGSVIGGLYAGHQESFPEFERRVQQLLAQGLMRSAIRKAFTTTEGLRSLYCWVILFLVNGVSFTLSRATWAISLLFPADQRKSLAPPVPARPSPPFCEQNHDTAPRA